MSEVEKMMQNAEVKKEIVPCPAKYYGYDCTRNNWDDEDCSCDIEGYPPFTAKKQIELIKFLLKNYEGVDIDKSFEESLAGAINEVWVDMSEEEKQQVKGILE